jgi:quercetin dioxygenase-like cupin family protein
MKLIKAGEGQYYDAQRHTNCWAVHKLTPGAESKRLNISYSHFLPNGGAEISSSPLERAYFVVSGSLKVKGKTEEYTLNQGDILYIGAGEERSVSVIGYQPASILVIMSKID